MAMEYKTLNGEELLQSLEECEKLLSKVDSKMEVIRGSVPELEGDTGFYKSMGILTNISDISTKITELKNLISSKIRI